MAVCNNSFLQTSAQVVLFSYILMLKSLTQDWASRYLVSQIHYLIDLSVYLEKPDLIPLGWSSHLAADDWQKVAAAHFRWGMSPLVLTLSTSLSFQTCLGSMVIQVWNLEIVSFFTSVTASCAHAFRVSNIAKMLKIFQARSLCIMLLK